MNKYTDLDDLLGRIKLSKVIAIVRGVDEKDISALFRALLDGGIEFVEITMNSPMVLKNIMKMNEIYGSKMIIGAGTVLNKKMAEDAISAGARFLVSPNVDKGMIETALSHDVIPFPGVMTPTEVANALNYGAPIVKLFPAISLGALYIKELMGPFSNIQIVAVGGINMGNAKDYIKAGAIGVGVGGSLINKKAIESGDFKSISDYASKLIKSMK